MPAEMELLSYKEYVATRIAQRICDRPPIAGMCLCSLSAGETCGVCQPSRLDKEGLVALIVDELRDISPTDKEGRTCCEHCRCVYVEGKSPDHHEDCPHHFQNIRARRSQG
jgi:hypothetical protein